MVLNRSFPKFLIRQKLSMAILLCGCGLLLIKWPLRLPKVTGDSTNNVLAINSSFKMDNEKLHSNLRDPISKLEFIPGISNETFQNILELNYKGNYAESVAKQVIIVSTWRSGSTFLNQLFDSHPSTFNHFEPLQMYHYKRIYKGDPFYEEAQQIILDLLRCRYRNLNYFNYLKKSLVHVMRNARMKQICSLNEENLELGFQRNFLKTFCSIFPISLMKLVGAGMNLMEPVLEMPTSNPYIIFLVRDPRAIVTSRYSWSECNSSYLCGNPSTLCKFMKRDLDIALNLKKKYPDKIHILRFEDLAWSPSQITQRLLNEMGILFVPEVVKFLEQHTIMEGDMDDPWSVARDSSRRVIHWITKIKENTLKDVESSCEEVMGRLGYLKIESVTTFLKQGKYNSSTLENSPEYSSEKILPSLSWYDRLYKKVDY